MIQREIIIRGERGVYLRKEKSGREKAAGKPKAQKQNSKLEPESLLFQNLPGLCRCYFCGLNQQQVSNQVIKFIAGPDVAVCARCIALLNEILEDQLAQPPVTYHNYQEECSFCGKKYEEVQRLLFGNDAIICVDCLELCTKILKEESIQPYGSQ
jgi:hypothetical protein